MKRIPELRGLSEDHHHALVLARRARRAAAGQARLSPEDAWAEVERRFQVELEPHFRIEERFLAPALEALGEVQLVRRLDDEHRALRAAVDGARTAAGLERFGELLEEHIRWEERELFETAQQRLGAEALAAVAQACRAQRTGE